MRLTSYHNTPSNLPEVLSIRKTQHVCNYLQWSVTLTLLHGHVIVRILFTPPSLNHHSLFTFFFQVI